MFQYDFFPKVVQKKWFQAGVQGNPSPHFLRKQDKSQRHNQNTKPPLLDLNPHCHRCWIKWTKK